MLRQIFFVALLLIPVVAVSPKLTFAQTAEGDILRGQGVFAAGAGWYNLNTAKGNAINVQAMRNYNEEVRLNYLNRVRYYAEKKAGKKATREEAAKRAQQRIEQLRSNPNNDDIRSGEALNLLAVMLTDPDVKQQDWYQNAVALPESASVKDVVFQYFPNKMSDKDLKIDVALSRLSKNVDWPVVFKAESFVDERAAYENAVSRVKGTVIVDKFDPSQVAAVDKCLANLSEEIKNTYADDKRGFKAKAVSFQGDLKAATKLFDGPVLDYAKDILRETEEYDAKSVGELVAFMLKYRLFFAQADSPRSIELYDKLFKAMDEQATKLGIKTIAIENVSDVDMPAQTPKPKPIDYFTVGSAWKCEAPPRLLNVTERKGNTFRATFILGNGNIERDISDSRRALNPFGNVDIVLLSWRDELGMNWR